MAQAVDALRRRDMAALARLADGHKGLRISPYAYVRARGDVVLRRALRLAFEPRGTDWLLVGLVPRRVDHLRAAAPLENKLTIP
jgi:hypothetical protein